MSLGIFRRAFVIMMILILVFLLLLKNFIILLNLDSPFLFSFFSMLSCIFDVCLWWFTFYFLTFFMVFFYICFIIPSLTLFILCYWWWFLQTRGRWFVTTFCQCEISHLILSFPNHGQVNILTRKHTSNSFFYSFFGSLSLFLLNKLPLYFCFPVIFTHLWA